MADEEENTEEGGEEEPKKKSKMLFIIIGVVVLLIGGGVPAFLMMSGGDEAKEEKEVEVKYETFQLKPFIVNLSDNSGFLKLVLLLEYDPTIVNPGGMGLGAVGGGGAGLDPLTHKLPGLLKDREPMIRDAIINLIGTKTKEALLSVDGKEALKEELIEAINDACDLDEAPVVGAYFLEFLIQ